MGPLTNQRHERFAQALAMGKSEVEAYAYAGFRADRGNASRLTANDSIRARVAELQRRGAERAEITVEQTLRELAKLGFSDIGKAIDWKNEVSQQQLEGGEGVPTLVLIPRVVVVDRDKLDDATRMAIAGISQTANGGLKVKMHDKHAALVSIGKHLGMFVDRGISTSTGVCRKSP